MELLWGRRSCRPVEVKWKMTRVERVESWVRESGRVCARGRGGEGGKDGVETAGHLGEDQEEDQPFSFTAGDPGSLWGGITCDFREQSN